MLSEVGALPEQRLLNTSIEDLLRYLFEKYQFEVPVLDLDNAVADQKEATVEFNDYGQRRSTTGTQVSLEIPFAGDAQMFQIQPSSFSTSPPYATVRSNLLVITQSGVSLTPEQVETGFDRMISEINKYLDWQHRDANQFNKELQTLARQSIEQRREKLLANQNLVAGLKFKLKARSDAPQTYSVPVSRKRIEPRLPPASTTPYKPEPVLAEDDYRNILKIIQDIALVIERSPSAFTEMGEEDLRQHFLVQLNGQYEGKATGETFNHDGKTDILIRHEGRNIFIAECKFWRGKKGYMETIDQLLSYLSWRDTKAAIIIFSQHKGFTEVLAKLQQATTQHPNYKSGPKVEHETVFRYVFGQRDDPNREVVVSVLAFDMPRPDAVATEPKVRSL
ncbi:hypothetical protein [Rhizobium sp.]|uniref:hypothetical protein n=1 Tax=Rhizobium sp. TaxID=391 RepID=UPI002690BE52